MASENFLAQFGEIKKISVVDFMKIWKHYDVDKSGYIETENAADGTNEFRSFVKDFLSATNDPSNATEENITKTVEHFIQKFDRNHDRKFELGELIHVLPVEENFMSKFADTKLTDEHFDAIFAHYDQDKSGKLQEEEIDGLIRDMLVADKKAITVNEIKKMREELLKVADLDGDGKIDRNEIRLFILGHKK